MPQCQKILPSLCVVTSWFSVFFPLYPSKLLDRVIQWTKDENIVIRITQNSKNKTCLVSRSHFIVNAKSTDLLEAETQILIATSSWLSALGPQPFALCLFWQRFKLHFFFFNLWKRLIALCTSRYYGHISKRQMPNSLGLWYTQMVFLFCIFANVITKYNNFSSKVIRAHLASSLICPTCYLLITLWGDLVVLS